MELNKVLEGFTVSNTLVIKAQVQVIRSVHPQPCIMCTSSDQQCRDALLLVRGAPGQGACGETTLLLSSCQNSCERCSRTGRA